MDDKLKKLEDLIELYKSSTISKDEYESLKKELLDNNLKTTTDIKLEPKIQRNIFEETIERNENRGKDIDKEVGEEKPKLLNNPKFAILLSFTVVVFILFMIFSKSSDEKEIMKICSDCTVFEKVRKTTFILVKNKDGKSNVYDTKTNSFILKNWYKAKYDEGAVYDDITFEVNGVSKMCPEREYHYLSEQGDKYLSGEFTTEESSNSSSTDSNDKSLKSRTCGWCNKSFFGDYVTHLGRISDCYTSSSDSAIGIYCSFKCCSESRRSTCPTCR
jgi:hypothetical protein